MSKSLKIIILVLVVAIVIVSAMTVNLILDNRVDNSSSIRPTKRVVIPTAVSSPKSCLDIELTSCSGGYTIADVKGWVINRCNHPVKNMRVIATIYDNLGQTIDTDEEYLLDELAVGDKVYFDAVARDGQQQLKRCTAEIDMAEYAR